MAHSAPSHTGPDIHRSWSSKSREDENRKSSTAVSSSFAHDPDSVSAMLFSGKHYTLLTRVGIDLSGRAAVLVRGQPKNTPFRLHVGYQTRKGSDSFSKGVVVKKKNQDSLSVITPFGLKKSASLFAVFDGHGKEGHHVSMFVTHMIVHSLKKYIMKFDPVRALKESIAVANKELQNSKKFDSFASGSTGVMTLVVGRELYCCNIGDSRCVLGRKFGEIYEAVTLSHDHKPDRPSEQRRIEKMGGKVQTYIKYDPVGLSSSSRVWLNQNKTLGPGLAVSRAFGDFLFSKSGVVCGPEIVKLTLNPTDSFFILASDGVFSVMSSQDVVDYVAGLWEQARSAKEVSQKICEEAHRRWKETDDGDRDDITCVIVFLEKRGDLEISNNRFASEPEIVCDLAPDGDSDA
mmetsp:Transcript_5966/g.17964  ORF Transcript_5966/g.17964 Transcript_5966/m.17964 type:complete len:404 (-) Transcript_5966:1610-2821(-)